MNIVTRALLILATYIVAIYWRKDIDLVGILVLLGSVALLLGPYATEATGSWGLLHRVNAPSPAIIWYIFGVICFITVILLILSEKKMI